ncbi:hypothetical protein WME99_30220 [Sorangium sp. So ce136]|uniref:hypothetical protein n=1 Tax=Sorangium sp. So ce136 TaxID=3133284 RepID=UPI003F100759
MRSIESTILAVCAALSTALSCNAIWGIPDGKPSADPALTGGGGAAGGTGGAAEDGGGGDGGAGGNASACPSEPFTVRAPEGCQAADSDHDYLSDRENCCVPGRSCLGGECEEGRCTPVILTTTVLEEHTPIGIAVEGEGDNGRVLWGSGYGGTVFATEKAAGGSTEPLVVLDATVTMLARDGISLFITDWNLPHVRRVPLQGNVTVPTVATAEGASRAWQPVVGNGWLYWVTETLQEDEAPDAPDAPHRIWAARADQADQTGLLVLDKDAYVGGLALDSTHLYWTEMELGATQISVQRMALGEPSEPELVASIRVGGDERPGDITVGERIYWVAAGDIYAADKDGSGAGVLAAADYPNRILLDSTFVYWFSMGDEQLRRVRTSGGAPETLAESPHAHALAQDCRAIYWTTAGTETSPPSVRMLAK